jgi:hypothetical protein
MAKNSIKGTYNMNNGFDNNYREHVRRVVCKVQLTSMGKPISKYHSVLVSLPRFSESKSKKHNISKDINNSKATILLNTIHTIHPKSRE